MTVHAWQDHSSQSMFYVLFPLQRNQTGPQSHVLQFCPLCRETRKDHSPTFNSSAPSAEKPERTTVPRSTVLPPLQRNQTGPQSHVLQFSPLCRETRKDHSPTFNSSAPSAEKPEKTTVPRSTVLPPLQRNQTEPQSPQHVLQFCPLCGETKDHSPTFNSSAPSAEKPRTTVPRSTVLPPLRRNQGPQSHVQQFCPLCGETKDHSPSFNSSAPSAEKPRTTVPRSTILAPLRRNQGPQSHVQQFWPLCGETR